MRRSGKEYDEIDKTVINIILDYDIKSFPIDEKEVCMKLGVEMVPYSKFGESGTYLLTKRSNYGFFKRQSINTKPMIFYNDFYNSTGSIRFTIFHEIKHYVYDDKDDRDDDLADHFARYIMCPTLFLLLEGIDSPDEIASFCGTSFEVAYYESEKIMNRRRTHGNKLFDYEIQLIKHLNPVLLEMEEFEERRKCL